MCLLGTLFGHCCTEKIDAWWSGNGATTTVDPALVRDIEVVHFDDVDELVTFLSLLVMVSGVLPSSSDAVFAPWGNA